MDRRCRPNICTTEKYSQNQKIVPGNRTYTSATKYGEKIMAITQKLKTSDTTLSIH